MQLGWPLSIFTRAWALMGMVNLSAAILPNLRPTLRPVLSRLHREKEFVEGRVREIRRVGSAVFRLPHLGP